MKREDGHVDGFVSQIENPRLPRSDCVIWRGFFLSLALAYTAGST